MTHTYAILEVSPGCYAEIRRRLEEAGYRHVFHDTDDGEVIDMHGLALQSSAPAAAEIDPRFAGARQMWGLITPRGLPVIYGDRASASEDRDTDERVALFEVREVVP